MRMLKLNSPANVSILFSVLTFLGFFSFVFCTDNKNNNLWFLWIVVYSSSVFHLWRT